MGEEVSRGESKAIGFFGFHNMVAKFSKYLIPYICICFLSTNCFAAPMGEVSCGGSRSGSFSAPPSTVTSEGSSEATARAGLNSACSAAIGQGALREAGDTQCASCVGFGCNPKTPSVSNHSAASVSNISCSSVPVSTQASCGLEAMLAGFCMIANGGPARNHTCTGTCAGGTATVTHSCTRCWGVECSSNDISCELEKDPIIGGITK